jgi:hypothetical protein
MVDKYGRQLSPQTGQLKGLAHILSAKAKRKPGVEKLLREDKSHSPSCIVRVKQVLSKALCGMR